MKRLLATGAGSPAGASPPKRRRHVILAILVLIPLCANATELNCHGPANVESFKYSWRVRGGLSWVAGFLFPTSGVGELKTTFPSPGQHSIDSSLLITANGNSGFYVYESQMDESAQKTLMTYHGYAFKNKSRKERTLFDYVKRLAHIHKETPEKAWDKVAPLPANEMRDMLTAIYFLRQNAATIRGPVTITIYSDGKEYPAIFRPSSRQVFTIEGQKVPAVGFEIVDAPGGRKWPGGIRVWMSDDARRIPFRIEIVESMASLQLDLQSIDACAFMQASR
jgi:hypothetical protein